MAVKRRAGGGTKRRIGQDDGRVVLPTRSKGRRPEFYEDPAVDQLFAIVTALTAEVSVLYDRLDTLERVLARTRALKLPDLESYVAAGEVADARVRRRDELLRRVFAVFEAYADRQTAAPR